MSYTVNFHSFNYRMEFAKTERNQIFQRIPDKTNSLFFNPMEIPLFS